MERTRVRDIMSSPVITIPPDTALPVATALMREKRVRHLPVVENGRMIGIVSRGDLREASMSANTNVNSYELNFMLSRLTVNQLMTRKVFTVTPDAPIVRAVELMTQHKIACLPVVDETDTVVGIVTEMDLLRMLARKLREADEHPTANV